MSSFMKIAATLLLPLPLALTGCMAGSVAEGAEDAVGEADQALEGPSEEPAPAEKAPEYQAPSIPAPTYKAPHYGAPHYQPPVYKAPVYQAATYQAPCDGDPYPVRSQGASGQEGAYPAQSERSSAGGNESAGPTFQGPVYQAPVYPAPIYQIFTGGPPRGAGSSYAASAGQLPPCGPSTYGLSEGPVPLCTIVISFH